MDGVTIAAIDVGSLAKIGWWRKSAREGPHESNDLDSLVEVIAQDLDGGERVALGFEAPLFVPVPADHGGLNRGRPGEGRWPWSAGAGATVLAIGAQQAAYVFSSLAMRVRPRVSFDPQELLNRGADLLVWEAFVTGDAKSKGAPNDHIADAQSAVEEFVRRAESGRIESDITGSEVLNLAAAGILASGLSTDVSLLKTPCIVVKSPAVG